MEHLTWLVPVAFLLVSVLVSALSHRALSRQEEHVSRSVPPCDHPWHIDGRCILCGDPE